jgi:peptide deformylase
MILPITAYGHPTLKMMGVEIDKIYPDLEKLIDDMFETMYQADGLGLAAQQINKAIRLFVIDTTLLKLENSEYADKAFVFINARINSEEGEEWGFEEGCLSIPGIHEVVKRKPVVYISYYDRDFNFYDNVRIDGPFARVIQHEYDHTEGKLFVERIPNIKKVLLKGKLRDISQGKSEAEYRMLLPRKKMKK